jgi:hypothetical protein
MFIVHIIYFVYAWRAMNCESANQMVPDWEELFGVPTQLWQRYIVKIVVNTGAKHVT